MPPSSSPTTAPERTAGTELAFDAAGLAQIEATIEHLNASHGDTVLLVAAHLAPGVTDAELVAIRPRGAEFSVRGTHSGASVWYPFPQATVDTQEIQGHLLVAVGAARAAADPSVPLTSLERELAVTAQLRTVHGRVDRVRQLTPDLLEVTLVGFDDYPLRGGDEFVYAMVSFDAGGIPPAYSMDDYRADPDGAVRGAYYTIRRSRPELGEIDLWVVVHDHPRSVASWMAAAAPGDPIALWGPRHGFELPDGPQHVLFVADETGFAAVAALVERADPGARLTAFLEVRDAAHRPELPDHPGLTVEWVVRGDDRPGAVNHLLAAVTASVDIAPDLAFGAAESRQISAVRRFLRSDLAMASGDVLMTGYWRADA